MIKSQEEIREENQWRLNRDMANAAKFGRTKQVEQLLHLGADANFVSPCNFGYTALHHAAREGHGDTIHILLKYGANTEVRDRVEHRTPLHCAAARSKIECVRILLDKGGAFIDARDKRKNTPLHHAINSQSKETILILVERGADKNLKNNQEQTPILLASKKNKNDCADILLTGPLFKDGRRKNTRKM